MQTQSGNNMQIDIKGEAARKSSTVIEINDTTFPGDSQNKTNSFRSGFFKRMMGSVRLRSSLKGSSSLVDGSVTLARKKSQKNHSQVGCGGHEPRSEG